MWIPIVVVRRRTNGGRLSRRKVVRFMAIRIKTRNGESIQQVLRRFKKLCEKEGLTKDVKKRQYFEKPSERRRRAARKSANRTTRPAVPGGSRRR